MKILVVDDDVAFAKTVMTSLASDGHEVVHVGSGKSAIDLLRKQTVDFVLLDQILPDIAGVDVLSVLKEDARTKNIPVIIFSAYFITEAKEQALKKGALDYLLKYEVESDKIGARIEESLANMQAPSS